MINSCLDKMISIPTLLKQIYSAFQTSRQNKNDITQLKTSFNPLENLQKFPKKLEHASWSNVFHFSFLVIIFVFSIAIMQVAIWIKLVIILVLVYINFAPVFAQFFNNGLPILAWVFLFFNSRFIPLSMKRPISVKVLPVLETTFYGDNLSEILASNTNTFLDIIAWLPYGLIHFALPFVVAFLIFVFAPPKTLPQFCWSFGYMNLTGVIIQDLVFSCAPPWYKVLHGLDKANYSMKGSPGGLGRIDQLLGVDMYTTGFTNSPLIFGAMPSLHSGCSTMDALWLTYLFPKAAPICIAYVVWLWFSTMYLTHHYFIDVVVGSCLAVGFFSCVKWRGKLPINDNFCRWNYDSVSLHNVWNEDPLKQLDYFNLDINTDGANDLENQIPLEDFTEGGDNNNGPNMNASANNSNSPNPANNKHLNNNNGTTDKSELKFKLEDDEARDLFESDDEIADANDIEKSANTTTKKTPKTYKESFEATLSMNHSNTSATHLPSSSR